MKVCIILLLALQVFWATANPTATVAPLPELSTNLREQCDAHCNNLALTVATNIVTIDNKDRQIKQLEAKIIELEAKLGTSNDKETEGDVPSTDDLVTSIRQKIHAIRDKVRNIGQIYSESSTNDQVVKLGNDR